MGVHGIRGDMEWREMEKFNIKPGWKVRAFAGSLVVIAVFDAIVGPLSSRILAAGLLLSAYDFAFVPSPPLNLRLSEIYSMARQGWRMSWPSKIRGATVFVLVVTSFYLKLQGR
jgi:hypothetical protein